MMRRIEPKVTWLQADPADRTAAALAHHNI